MGHYAHWKLMAARIHPSGVLGVLGLQVHMQTGRGQDTAGTPGENSI